MSLDEPTAQSLRRGIRADLFIAVCALLISGLATAASLWQSHVVAQQLSAQVWPYITFGEDYDENHVTFSVENDGLGPAVMRSVVATIDGKPQRTYLAMLRALIAVSPAAHDKNRSYHVGLTMRAQGEGSVLRAGQAVSFVEIRGGRLPREIGPFMTRVQLSACYSRSKAIAGWSTRRTPIRHASQRVRMSPTTFSYTKR